MTTPSARSVALEAVRRVIDEGAYSNRVIPSLLGRAGLDARDRAFASELAYGTLRFRLRLDHAIAIAARRDATRITPSAIHLLRLGAYQLLVAGVAPHAAVGETVELAGGRERGFVNAVLRRLAAAPPPLPTGTRPEAVGARTGMIPWAVNELRVLLGDEAEDAAAAFVAQGPLTLRATGDREDLLAALDAEAIDAEPGPLDRSSILVHGGDPSTFPGYDAGLFAIQDQASTLVVRMLDPGPGDRVVDLCAAPGGKCVFAAQLVAPDGWVLGADRHETRVGLIRRDAVRLGVAPGLVVQDATAPAVGGGFDRVLVDAPCSGLGSSRRRPELLWRVPADRVSVLAVRQLAILRAGAERVGPSGRLVYSVCTFARAETDGVVDVFLRGTDLRPVVTDGPDGPAERHRIWPHRHGADGMFVAAFERPV
jgi:16S rRNA (cytosine967-C5)-methyltransferase